MKIKLKLRIDGSLVGNAPIFPYKLWFGRKGCDCDYQEAEGVCLSLSANLSEPKRVGRTIYAATLHAITATYIIGGERIEVQPTLHQLLQILNGYELRSLEAYSIADTEVKILSVRLLEGDDSFSLPRNTLPNELIALPEDEPFVMGSVPVVAAIN